MPFMCEVHVGPGMAERAARRCQPAQAICSVNERKSVQYSFWVAFGGNGCIDMEMWGWVD